VNFVASTLMNGASARRAKPSRDLRLADAGRADHQDVLRRDLLPQRLRHLQARQRLRSAIATARLAASCPTMCLSSSLTISEGVMCDIEKPLAIPLWRNW
jgi:hypothetical protein